MAGRLPHLLGVDLTKVRAAFDRRVDPERTLNRASSDADCLPFHARVVCSRLEARVQVDLVDLLESVSSVVRIF
jgi:hypothetical protein